MINKVIIVGNLGKDPEIKNLEGGKQVASFSVATSESYMDKNTNEKVTNTEWHNVSLWGGLAGVAEKYLKKGNSVYIEGSLKTRSYENKEGATVYRTEIVGRTMKMLGGKGEGGGQSATPQQTLTPEEIRVKELEAQLAAAKKKPVIADDTPF